MLMIKFTCLYKILKTIRCSNLNSTNGINNEKIKNKT